MTSEQDFKCVFCSETFVEKEELQSHFRKHADPCFNLKKNKGRPQDEVDSSTEKLKDRVEMVECDVCSEVFTSISKAITHKHKVHPDHDAKHFCPWCGKLFTMKHLYNKHIQVSHSDVEKNDEQDFHCDNCDVDFNVPAAMAYHNKFYHRQDELSNIGLSKKLKMIFQEVVQIFYCPFCGEEYDNKINLHKHMNDDHSDENQSPHDVFRCPLCDAIFYHLDAYELHLTYHSIEDLYTERGPLMDEVTDFSLESVPPMLEKIENVQSQVESNSETIGIEELLELTMDETKDHRKSKKHKKHKKSKKAAITLDEFLNMNKDVFGEGIDFQGVEEVPTQVIAKRFKSTKKNPASSKLMSSDIEKLKRQGIVVKKKPTKSVNTFKKTIKNVNVAPSTKSTILTSSDDVLSKLLNQGSQIKIVKKSNKDAQIIAQNKEENNDQLQGKESNEERLSPINTESKDNEGKERVFCENISDMRETEDKNLAREKDDANGLKQKNLTVIIQDGKLPKTESPTEKIDTKSSQNSDEDSRDSSNFNVGMKEDFSKLEKANDVAENSKALRNNNANTPHKQDEFQYKENQNNIGNKASNDDGSIKVKKLDLQNNTEQNATIVDKSSSLNALKHLTHLITIKPVNQTQNMAFIDKNKTETNLQNTDIEKLVPASQNNSSKTADSANLTTLKNLGSITIKSKTQLNVNTPKPSTTSIEGQSDDNNDDDTHATDDEWNEKEGEKSATNKINIEKISHILKSPQLNVQTKQLPKTIQKESPKGTANSDNNQSSVDLLKHLKNVTAKPVSVSLQGTPTPKSSPNTVKRSIIAKPTMQKEVNEQGIEIFNIDDSDSDEANCNNIENNQNNVTEIKKEILNKTNVFKNINKNVTIKSLNQQKITKTDAKKTTNQTYDEGDEWGDDFDEDESHTRSPNSKLSSPKPNQKQVAINNVLKNLSKNITVKSRNSSPSQFVQHQDHNSKDCHLEANEADCDSDSPSNRVKITEIENMSDEEFTEKNADSDISRQNIKVQHPDDSHSDNDDGPMDEDLDDLSDFESQIAASTVKKVNDNSRPHASNVKNLNKDITIKSSNNKSVVSNMSETADESGEIPHYAKNLSSQISIKQIRKEENKNEKQIEQAVARSNNQPPISQKMASSSNQVNTFNKEVKTVKTFQTQTKTVIQEITTTVTKTIKTVNQTTKQEFRNVAQSSSTPTIAQKVHGMNANLSQKNFQGMKVRQASPNVRPKLRGPAPQPTRPAICAPPQPVRSAICVPPQTVARPAICAPPQPSRPALCAPVRASNQLVPVRPVFNRPGGPRPRMPNAVNIRASTSGQQTLRMGKPVKVSPAAVIASPKKPAEETGHFSCFKKPKESLIPVPDFPIVSKSEGDSTMQFSSAVHMSKSNFSCTTKTVKGNSVVTSTQMKSEMSASSQQLSKLRNMSGLSVVKTSQAKQTQVEEKSEMSASKRNTLEAIQKLQSQGLLVKKPRLDVSEDSEHSCPGSDDMGHDSNEEFDE